MNKPIWMFAVVATALLLQCYAETAWAQNSNGGNFRTWISPTGSDSNSGCQASAPCASFAEALSQTAEGGEVSCLGGGEASDDNTIGGGGQNTSNGVTITGTITIDCHGTSATHMPTAGLNGFYINAPNSVVTLRGLNINGFKGYPLGDAGSNGVSVQAAAVVNIEDCVIENLTQKGIVDQRTGGGTQLFIKNTVIRGNGGAGIVAAGAATNSVVLENVQSVGNQYGIAVATGNHVIVSRSVMSGNSVAGIEADPGAKVSVDNTEITHNAVAGIQAYGTITLANSDISYNSTAISGATTSYGNSRIFGNSQPGTTPTPIGPSSAEFGQM